MNLEKHTPKSREALLTAQNLAKERQHPLLEPSHVLLALIQQPDGIVRAIVTTVAGGVEALRDELSADLDRRPRVHGPNLEFGMTSQTADVLASAERYSRDMQDGYVSTEHLLLALADSSQKKRLADFGLTQSSICAALKAARAARPERTQPPKAPISHRRRGSRRLSRNRPPQISQEKKP